ncbi:MAG: 4Fe-4S binding protein [Saprospiraceae bacterium]|nr:4Fe-4S binding protein [Saprospiraceae bacterium]MDW8229961.1 4Fe-4S binding protein [Saprospiraceae bacterium]
MQNASLSIAQPAPVLTPWRQKVALALGALGALLLLIVWAAGRAVAPVPTLLASLGLMAAGAWLFVREEYLKHPAGIRNNGAWFRSLTARGVWGWVLGVFITGFYVCLYWFPQYLKGLIELFTPLSQGLRARAADQWFVYGTLYTVAVLLMGVKFFFKYRHNAYQRIRTVSVVFFQLWFAWLLPGLLVRLQQPEIYFSYFWPLSYYQGTPMAYQGHLKSDLGLFYFFFGLAMFFIGTPVLTYFFGKRWYCSWVCGCGGLAETAGDPFRHLSDKSLRAWRIERWLIYSVLLFAVAMTALLWINVATGRSVLQQFSESFYKTYSFLIGAAFSGVVGVGFYPLLGSRVWCRFGCPMAAWLGIWQRKKSRFRITTNGGQCISCGNCSAYCEMGIDVRAYAQRGEDIVRASCVGCGICSAVCPRGVLRLEA